MKKLKRNFTLVEIIISVLLIGIISSFLYFSFAVLTQITEKIRDREIAIDFAQKIMEDIRTQAQNNFDQINNYTPEDISQKFSWFNPPVVNITDVNSDLKKIEISISWNERGKLQDYNLSFYLSRPPMPLPANICGRVFDGSTHNPINGLTVKVSCATNPSLSFQTFTGRDGCAKYSSWCNINGGCYTFADINPNTGTPTFKLDPGKCQEWNLKVIGGNQYYDKDYPKNPIHITEGVETDAEDIYLDRRQAPATITGRVVDKDTDSALDQYVSLYENGKFVACRHATGSFSFQVDFEKDQNQRCFTLVTYSPTLCGAERRAYPYVWNKHCGDFSDCEGWGKSYNYRGWSSAVCNVTCSNGTCNSNPDCSNPDCSKPWFGGVGIDGICVQAGDNVNIGDIKLVHVPTATLKGQVLYKKGPLLLPVSKATVYINWHPCTGSRMRYTTLTTNIIGYFKATVPAEQSLFPDEQGYYLLVRAAGYVLAKKCCNTIGKVWRGSSWQRVGPLYEGSEKTISIVISAPDDYKCGNVEGRVIDGETEGGIKNVDVYIAGYGWKNKATDNTGWYKFVCPPQKPGYAVPIGTRRIIARKNGYYPCDSKYNYNGSNYWYDPSNVPEVIIKENQVTTHPDIKLWPKGYGKIEGKVLRAGTVNLPINNAKVTLQLYTGTKFTTYTDSNGEFEFNNVLESWPPPNLPSDDPYYNHTSHTHIITVEHEGYETYTLQGIQVEKGETTQLTIYLLTGGGV